uniref:LicD-family phosphotransferase n=1 Tax=Streptococcus suis TaxID=1307 RepID=M1VDJ3_STRSU|nr:LicD-family phosphotransferase [Streptococcus suis]
MKNRVFNTGETPEDLKRIYNYDGSTLRKAQLRMIEMLSFLDNICKENNITYFLAFGTLLGAKRHGGFIPWDDDMDVFISSSELKRLRKIINNGDYQFVIQDNKIDKGFVRYYNVLRDLNSEYIKDEFVHNQRKYRGVQIDLFPYDYGVMESGKKLIGMTMGFNEKFLLGKYPFLCSLFFKIVRNFIIPLFRFFSKFRGKKYISLGYEGVSLGYTYLAEDIFPLGKIEFEGLTVPVPNKIEKILVVDYGKNYDFLPDIDDRNQHRVLDIKFYK